VCGRYKVSERAIKDGRISVLLISDVQEGDFGMFTCSTDNGYGQVHLDITLSERRTLYSSIATDHTTAVGMCNSSSSNKTHVYGTACSTTIRTRTHFTFVS